MIGEGKMREEFEAFVLSWTGKTIGQHEQAGATGLYFAWECWRRAATTAKMEAIRGAQLAAEVAK